MSVLEKLKLSMDSDDDFPSEYDDEKDGGFNEGIEFPISDDDPRRDPAPGETPPRKRAAPARARPGDTPRVTKRQRDDATSELTSLIEFAALLIGMQSPPIGDQLESDAPDIAAKVVKIAARNPKWLMSLAGGSVAADAIALLVALLPTIKVTYKVLTTPSEGGDQANGVEFDPAKFAPYDPTGGGLPR